MTAERSGRSGAVGVGRGRSRASGGRTSEEVTQATSKRKDKSKSPVCELSASEVTVSRIGFDDEIKLLSYSNILLYEFKILLCIGYFLL